jgi:hypothetical protein
MYQLTIKNPRTNQQEELSLPLTDYQLSLRLEDNGIINIDDAIILTDFVNDSDDFPHLPAAMLESADLFEVNYLTQRIQMLSAKQQDEMDLLIKAYDLHDIADLINLTYEVEQETYRILKGVSNHEELGRWFVMQSPTETPGTVLNQIDYAKIGSGLDVPQLKGAFCEGNYVYCKEPFQERVYDGKHLPYFSYEVNDTIAVIQYVNDENDSVSYLTLPAGEIAMQRVMKELGCETFDNCHIDLKASRVFCHEHYLKPNENIEKLNELCKQLHSLPHQDFVKLQAVVEYTQMQNKEVSDLYSSSAFEKLNLLYHHLNDFEFFPNIHSPEQYAEYLVNETDIFHIGEELTAYIQYEELGYDWTNTEGGRFVSGGYVIDETRLIPTRGIEDEIENLGEEELEQ